MSAAPAIVSTPASPAHAAAARANARRFAEAVIDEPDEAMKSYLRHIAVSWSRVAEQHEFLLDTVSNHAAA